jgi:hypothetical protein
LASRILVDQLTPHLPKDNEEVNTHVKHLQVMLDAVSLYQRNATEDETGMTEIYTMSSAAEMHVAGLKTGARSMSTLNRNSVKKGTMTTTVPIRINLTNTVLLKEGATQEESKLFPTTCRVCAGP